jgi:hypothetical protein
MFKMRLLRFFTLIVLFLPQIVLSQVTTSSITGTVKTSKGEELAGATITAIHLPSGTKYATMSKRGGVFTLPAVRTGGPYQVTIGFVGYIPEVIDNFMLQLGEPFNMNVVMAQNSQQLTEIVVSTGRRKAAPDKMGASTNLTSRQLTTLPSISRSITDFTRLVPQAGGSVTANNTSFGGRDGRSNNVQVDGANLNNNFGLSNDLLPGGGNPISLDAIDEVSINIAPFDVRQANFTGAGVNAITKSGTNTIKGSAYTFYRDQSFNGLDVAGSKLPAQASQKNQIFGGTLGGPIIKNKLFFFISGEYEKKTSPGVNYKPAKSNGSGTESTVPLDSLKKLSDYLVSKYNYNPGTYENFPNFAVTNHKYLAKVDWNISTAHKLTLKYSDYVQTSDGLISQSGGINGANSSGIVTYGPRFSPIAMSYANVNYTIKDIVRSGSLELNSNFNGKFANQFLGTITKIRSLKGHPGETFPFVDILGPAVGSKNNYISFGNEPFNGNNNDVINNIYTITDNFSYFAGRHTLTAGGSYEFQKVGNMFMAGSQGYYAYGSVDDFVNNRAPKLFSQTYSLLPGQDAVYSANLKIGQLGLYVQDEFNVNEKFKIVAGLRIDKPVYPEQPLENKAISALPLYDAKGNLTHYTTGQWPKASIYWSPRVGFRWDTKGDKDMIIRGGTGIFTGRIPFVYLTNIPSNSGMYQFGALVTSNLQNFPFSTDPHKYNPFYNTALNPAQFPTTAGTVVPSGGFAVTDHNFKFPQVWRSNIAVDKQLGNGFALTLEAMYTKDINAVYMFNANQKVGDTLVVLGSTTRSRFSTAAARKLNAASGSAIVLNNTRLGGSFVFTAQVSKSFAKGFYGSLAYNYTFAQDVTANPGSQANSVWAANATSRTQNDLELAYSGFAVPHRIIANFSYRIEYVKHLASTFSLFYEGANPGTFSYIYNGDINNDGNSADLMYIPKDPSEINFIVLPAVGTTPAFTAQQQSDAFFSFIAQDKYLKKHQGQVAERNGSKYPWYHKVDFKFTQDIFTNIGAHRNTLQLTADITNFLNLLNSNWGVRSIYVVNNPLIFKSYSNGKPNFNLQTYNGALLNRTFINNNSTTSTWGLQLGLRYSF